MNNLIIHLKIQNPKKASNSYEIGNEGLLPNEPVNRQEEERIEEPLDRQCEARVWQDNVALDQAWSCWRGEMV